MDYNSAKNFLNIGCDNSVKFEIISLALDLLNNPLSEMQGRELVIRILDKKSEFSLYQSLLKILVRKSGLYPYLLSEFDNLNLQDKLVLDAYKPNIENSNFVFHSLQRVVYNFLMRKNNVVLSANTSVGKSAIIDSLIESNEFRRIVIIVPTIALIDETRRRLDGKFSNSYQIITHSSQETKSDKCIYILTQERVLERDDLENLDIFILDEFYKLNIESENDARSIILNIAFTKVLKKSKQFYFIGPNIDAVVGLKNLGLDYIFIPSEFSTVALNIYELNLPCNGDERINKTIELLKSSSEPTMIYCQSPSSAIKVTREILANIVPTSPVPDKNFINWLTENYHKEWVVIKALEKGIGIHHGSLPRSIQQKIVRLFNNRKINVLICTSTIIEGVNTSAKNVIIYDRRNNTPLVTNFTHKNIQGRAGRMGQYFIGNVYCLEEIPSKSEDYNTVKIEAGIQAPATPLNLLYGVENEYLTESSKTRMHDFESISILPAHIFSSNPKYPPRILEEVAKLLTKNLITDYSRLMWSGLPNKEQMHCLCQYIYILEANSINRLHLNDYSKLSTLIIQYLASKSHSTFIKQKISHYENNDGDISDTVDWLLKICRNLFNHNLPSAISAFTTILQYICKRNDMKFSFDYSLIAMKLENAHLQSNFYALDEFGIPLQVAEKLSYLSIFATEDLDGLIFLIKSLKNTIAFEHLTDAERNFINESL
ncbi:helicase-related protein [Klebsiella variicola]|uniref:helicase-related protein n=1 Tax=Klebsiella variicola TaxID=244366 RepID=UPI001CF2A031|nr:helicase-related protein [Klebsiella variicola]MCB3487938.1 DEAD/DEAH box helicase [Klebsiella variicola]MCD9769689.1 DEAD/DEAH box helicase [Klebsiella variicola subsp. variicola]MCD9917748.1 DEAD/DEAH box helicase [Klebsiella variicola subsp. variicola]HBX9982428.1 DEAD/DEAH box helicase [Klebsiella variicola]HBZ6193781.1 DEAD/DEAH box helicase [Klebsiella variicola]